MGRRAYKTRCRFLKDNNTEAEIRWVEVPDTTPTLPFWSGIYSLDQTRDKWAQTGLGEVLGAVRTPTLQKAPNGFDGHKYCGTPEEFEIGGKYEPDKPPAVYDAQGFLACCEVPQPPPPPKPWAFSSTCFTANGVVGQWYRGQLLPGNNFPNFCSVSAVQGNAYCVEWLLEGDSTVVTGEISYGVSCQASRNIMGPMPTPGRYSVPSQLGNILWLEFRPQVYNSIPQFITWRIMPGICVQ